MAGINCDAPEEHWFEATEDASLVVDPRGGAHNEESHVVVGESVEEKEDTERLERYLSYC